jgi:DNA polymerase III sliding clamp (beta) subunit (PCNA family)
MNFSIETKELQKIVSLLGVTAKVNVIDFSGQVLIEANENNTVSFVSNNGSTAISVLSDKVKVNTPGSVIILYGYTKSFISSLQPWNGTYGTKEVSFVYEEHVDITVENIHENGEKSTGKLRADCFHDGRLQKPAPFGNTQFILNSNMFKKAIGKVVYAMDPTENRAFIQGMNLSFGKDDIYFCGTNGRILSEYTVKNTNDLNEENYLMKYDFIMGLRRAVGEETQIFFEVDGRKIKAKFDNVVFQGILVIGHEYPNYKPVLQTYSHVITANKDALMAVLTPFTDILDAEDNHRLTFEVKNKTISFHNEKVSYNCDFGIDYDGSFVIDVNGVFLLHTIDAINDDQILIKFSDEKGVLIFDSGNFKDQKALITPIRRR